MQHLFGKRERKRYAATAQAEFQHGSWHGSTGLRSTTFEAPSQKFAEQLARAHYKQEWLGEKSREWWLDDVRLIKPHICVVEL